MSRLLQLALVLAVATVVGVAWLIDLPALIGGAQGPAPGRKPSTARRPGAIVQPVTFASDATTLQAVGTARAVRSVILFPEGSGRVTEVLFSAGQKVRAGEPLLRLDAEAETLAAELARLKLKDARQRLARQEPLAARGALSRSQLDRTRTDFLAARIALAQAELALAKRLLVAPFTGVAGIPEVEVGQRITPETPIAPYDDRANLLIDFEVPEVFAPSVKVGAKLEVYPWSGRGRPVTGRVKTVASRIDSASRSLRVRAHVSNARDRFRPGMSFSVKLVLAGRKYPAVAPIAVQWSRQGAYVWRIRGGKAETVPVKVLKRSGGRMIVDGPLARDDLVVVEGVQRLRPGREVEVQVRRVQVHRAPERGGAGASRDN